MTTPYVDPDTYSSFVHWNHRNGNFVEQLGDNEFARDQTPTTSPWTSPATANFNFRLVNETVHMELPQYIASTTATAATIVFTSLVPTAFRPAINVTKPVVIHNNGLNVLGTMLIATTGTVTFTYLAGNFQASAAAGFLASEVSWELSWSASS